MKEQTVPSLAAKESAGSLPGPKGVGMAVAFDWGLVVQILVTPFLSLALGSSGPFPFKLPVSAPVQALITFLISLPFAAAIAVFGEGVRRGWRWTRGIQVAANAILFLAGLASILPTWQSIRQGDAWPLVTTVILVIFSPLIAWRLNRLVSVRWFAQVTSAEARRRHGGAWPFLISLWALAGGVLQALATFHR